jgi:UDP-N-acetylmuramoyl-tripeptide--D-alanyl-D-alanine ligase
MRKQALHILNILSARIVEKYKPVVIGVTGSSGKSITSRMIYEVLKTKYDVRLSDGRLRTDISVPLAIIGADRNYGSFFDWLKVFGKALSLLYAKNSFYPDVLVLEMGVDRPNDMKKMLEIVHPNIAVFTGIGEFPAHTEYFKSDKHIAREKSLLFKSLLKNDLAILNIDDPYIKNLGTNLRAQKMTFGFVSKAMVKGEEIFLGEKKWKTDDGKIGMSFKIAYEGTNIPFRFSYALGRGQIYSALAATSVGLHFGFNMVEISQALSGYRTLPGRMNLIKGINNSIIIDDTFNANPGSALAALETVQKLEAKRKIAVLADMLELGNSSEKGHRKVGEYIPNAVDLVFCYGKMGKYFCRYARSRGMKEENIFCYDERDELIKKLKNTIEDGDVVLVKGSRLMKMEKIVKEIMLEPERAEELLVK